MPASKRVSLKDREERESNVRRALGAFITQPQETMDITKDTDGRNDANDTRKTLDTGATKVTDDMKETSVTSGTVYTRGTPITDVTNDAEVTGVTNVRKASKGTKERQATDVTRDKDETSHKRVTKNTKGAVDTSVRRTADPYDVYAMRGRDAELAASFMLKGRRFDPPVGARKRQNYALSSETIKRIALASAHAGVGKAELVDAVLCAALRDILGDEG